MIESILNKQREYIDKVYLLNHDSNRIKRYSSKTFGCQMNENDSEKISGLIEEMGYVYVEDFNKADIIFYNTCCIRESAEEKTFGWIGELKKLKQENKELIICLAGCMMEQKEVTDKIRKSYRYVDIIIGTDDIHLLPELIFNTMNSVSTPKGEKIHDLIEMPYITRTDKHKAYVTIMKGCNNFCSYCIVPYVRGREKSRDIENILSEVKQLADEGYKEVTLLGQNVNSYGNDLGLKEGFTDILYSIAKIDNIERIRFMTSHPKDLSNSLIKAVKDLDKVCNYIHLPLQSGSSKILKAMNRHYSKQDYLDLVFRIKDAIPDITITSDIIVGFPGETEEDFLDTLDVIDKVRFDNSYMFIYSKRNGTKAAKRTDHLEPDVIKERFDRLLKFQNDISLEKNQHMLGKTYKVLIDGTSKNNRSFLSGRTEGNKLVHVKADQNIVGKIVDIKITDIKSFSLEGIIEDE